MKALRAVGTLVATVAAGGFAGFVLMAFIAPMLPGPTQPGNRHELSQTRAYVLAVLERDAATVNALEMPKNPADRAQVWKNFEEALELEPATLTYLGGTRAGELGSYVYVLGAHTEDQQLHLVPFSLVTIGNKIADLRGGSTGE